MRIPKPAASRASMAWDVGVQREHLKTPQSSAQQKCSRGSTSVDKVQTCSNHLALLHAISNMPKLHYRCFAFYCFFSNHEQCIHYIHSVFICMHMQWGRLPCLCPREYTGGHVNWAADHLCHTSHNSLSVFVPTWPYYHSTTSTSYPLWDTIGSLLQFISFFYRVLGP